MKIQSVDLVNFKGQNRSQKLTGRDIISAGNGKGKTSVLQAMGVAMLGYVPGQGKTPAETYKLASGESMHAGIKTELFQFTRTFTKVTKESKKTGETKIEITQDITLNPSGGERTITEKQARIESEIGNFPVMLDFNEFLSLSDTKRREFFYNLSPITIKEWDKEKIWAYLEEELLTRSLKVNNPDKYQAMKTAIQETTEAFPDHYDVQAGLVTMLDFAKNKYSYWDKQKKNAEGAVKKLAEIKNSLDETDRNIANNKKALEELQKKLLNLTAQIAGDIQKKKALEERNRKIQSLREDIAKIQNEECQLNITTIQAEIEELKSKISPIPHYPLIRAELDDAINSKKTELETEEATYNDLRQAVNSAKGEIEGYKKALATVNQQSGEDRRCVIHHSIRCNKDFSQYPEYVEKLIAKLQTKVNEDTEQAEITLQTINRLKKEIQDLINKKNESYDEESRILKANREIENKIHSLQGDITIAQNYNANKEARIKEKQEELTALETTALDEHICDLEAAETLKTGYENEISGLKAKIEEQEKAKITLSNLQRSMIDDKESGYYADCFKLIVECLGPKGIQGEIVKSILEPIRADLQEKFNKLGIGDKEFFFHTESDTGKEVFQFGWAETRDDKWLGPVKEYRNFDALSNGEKMLFLIALLTLFIEKANPKIKILMLDDVQELDPVNFKRAIDGLNAIGGNIDNIILCGVVDKYLEVGGTVTDEYQGFKVWRLDKEAVEG